MKDVPCADSTSRRFKRFARAFFLLIALFLALFSAANMDILWEKGIELLQPGSRVDVEGLSTDIINMVSAREFLYLRRSPATPPLEVRGRDIFISYDPWLRRNISIEMMSAAVDSRLLPASGAGQPALPILGLFRSFHINCPKARFHILWNAYSFSCEESRVTCECTSGEDVLFNWDIPRSTLSRGDNLIALLSDVSITDIFKRKEAMRSSSFISGLIDVNIGHIEIDMEALSSIGNREKFLFTGRFAGEANIALDGKRLKRADAKLFSEGGGLVTILREFIDDYLGRMALTPQRESMKIVLESLQDYAFNRGVLGMKLIGDEIVVDVDLDGESGSRRIEFALHDFLKDGKIVGKPIILTRR